MSNVINFDLNQKLTLAELRQAQEKEWAEMPEQIKKIKKIKKIKGPERRFTLRAYEARKAFGLWDSHDPVANAILALVETQNALAVAIYAEVVEGVVG
jgi:hypothetical protein